MILGKAADLGYVGDRREQCQDSFLNRFLNGCEDTIMR